jgi:surface polysaccharide O-acyltransferase-like enzyme
MVIPTIYIHESHIYDGSYIALAFYMLTSIFEMEEDVWLRKWRYTVTTHYFYLEMVCTGEDES